MLGYCRGVIDENASAHHVGRQNAGYWQVAVKMEIDSNRLSERVVDLYFYAVHTTLVVD